MGRHGTIAGRKEAQDKKRGAQFTKYARLITVATREGADPQYNVALKHAIEKAKSINMPNDNIQRAIKKGSGNLDVANYEHIVYEGYGPNGVAIIAEILTDNRNRTAATVKTAFDRNGGKLGVTGSVSYLFNRKGVIEIEKTDSTNEDEIMSIALENGMEDMEVYDDSFYILTQPNDFESVKDALVDKGYTLFRSDIELVPTLEVNKMSPEDKETFEKLIDILEDNDDVQKVYHNYIEQ